MPEDTTTEPDPVTSTPVRPSSALLAKHIRAAIHQSAYNLTQVMEKTGIGNRRYLNQMERGDTTLTDEQVSVIAELIDVSVQKLYSGEGLRVKQSKSRALTVAGKEQLTLPPISPERRQEFYRDLCLRRGVKIADGQDVGELLEAARQGGEQNWHQLWLRVTEQGQNFEQVVTQTAEKTKKMGVIARTDFLKAVHDQMFPSKEENE